MSSDKSDKEATEPEVQVKEIGAWSRRYAQNRTVPIAANIVVVILGMGAIWGLATLVSLAFGGPSRGWARLIAMELICLALIWLDRKRGWGQKQLVEWISDWVYRSEGKATVRAAGSYSVAQRKLLSAIGMVAGLGVMGAYFLCLRGRLSLPYMQPIAAVVVVPVLVYQVVISRGGFFSYLWPGLYALQAILILLGMPLYFHFSRLWWALNVLIPLFGYALIAALAGHIYSRYALRKLRRLATVSPEEAQEA